MKPIQNIPNVQHIPNAQQLKTLECMIYFIASNPNYFIASKPNLFTRIPHYYVKQDTVFDGNCGLQAIKIATKSTSDLIELRNKMVILIAHYYKFIANKSSIEEKIISIFTIFNDELEVMKNYFIRKADAAIFAEETADPTLENLSKIHDKLQQVQSLKDIIDDSDLTDFIIRTGVDIDYDLIALECKFGSTNEEICKRFSVSGTWLTIDCIKLLMLNAGYCFKSIHPCHIENYKKYITAFLTFQHIKGIENEVYIINARLPKMDGLHWACATNDANDPEITQPKIKYKKEIARIEIDSNSDICSDDNELSLDHTAFYQGLLDVLKIVEDNDQKILREFNPLYVDMLEAGLEDDDATTLLYMLPAHILATEQTLYDYIDNFIKFVNTSKQFTMLKITDSNQNTSYLEIMPIYDILYTIKPSNNIIKNFTTIILVIPVWKEIILKIGQGSSASEIDDIITKIIPIMHYSGDKVIENSDKYKTLLLDIWDKFVRIGISKDVFLKIIENFEGISHHNKFQELEFIKTNYAQFAIIINNHQISGINCIELFFKKKYSENLEEMVINLPDINKKIILLLESYLNSSQAVAITGIKFINETYSYIIKLMSRKSKIAQNDSPLKIIQRNVQFLSENPSDFFASLHGSPKKKPKANLL